MYSRFTRTISRRSFGLGLVTASATILTACGGTANTSNAADLNASAVKPPAGPWTFTDDQNRVIKIDQAPVRIAGYVDSMLAMMDYGIAPVALWDRIKTEDNSMLGGRDLSKVQVVGNTYGEIQLEKLAATRPDLIVTTVYVPDPKDIGAKVANGVPFGIKDLAQLKALQKIAPVVAIAMSGNGIDVIGRFNKFATALGVDLNSGQPAKDKAEFESAKTRLSAAAKKGLIVQPMAPDAGSGIYVARAQDDPQLSMWQTFGVDFPDVKVQKYFWDNISMENADKYPCDVILCSELGSMLQPEFVKQPTVAKLPAVKAKQVYTWRNGALTYRSQAKLMQELAGWLEAAKKVA